jgi:hypothetical protein
MIARPVSPPATLRLTPCQSPRWAIAGIFLYLKIFV